MQPGRMVVVGGAVGIVILAVALAWWSAPPSGPPLAGASDGAAGEEARRPGSSSGGPEDGARGRAAGARSGAGGMVEVGGASASPAPGADAVAARAPAGATKAPRRDFASPEEAEAFVAGRVLDMFAVVAPELDREQIRQTCSADGRDCTFEGPWPGDDFFKRWTQAIAEGRTSHAAFEGVTLSKFSPVDEDGGDKRMVIEAHAP